MRRIFTSVVFVLLISMVVGGCTTASTSTTNETSSTNSANNEAASEPRRVTVPSGTYLRIVLKDGVSTEKSSPGDQFNATLTEGVMVNGHTIFLKGSTVHGRVVDVQEPGRVKGLATLKLVLTSVELNGKAVPIETQTYIGIARNTKKRDAAVIGGAAGVGAAIGAIAGGGKGAAEGAAIGGGAGAGTVLVTKGEQLHYPPETRLRFTLSSPVEV
jgi:hypothetical protein